jgi:histidinol phosphatase-like PHP family hydrolase
MQVHTDWHVHSRHSPCGKPEATMALIWREAQAAGILALGVTDHLNCHLNESALRAARQEYDALTGKGGFLFGLEVCCLRRYDLDEAERLGAAASIWGPQQGGPAGDELTLYLPERLMADLRPAYLIGGVHSPLGAALDRESVIRQYHRQYVFLACHPAVDVVAHPWWWQGAWLDSQGMYSSLPWFDDLSAVPSSMHDELAAASREHSTAIEINAGAIFANAKYPDRFKDQYLEYLAYLKDAGVTFAVGSDSHHAGYDRRLRLIEPQLDALGLTEEQLWRPDAGAA